MLNPFSRTELLLGRDNSRALVQGLAAGVTEAITEKLGMDRLTAAFSLGKGGGYRLHGSPEQYTIRQLIELIEGPLAPVSCLEPGKNPCGRVAHCRTLPLWQGLEQVIGAYLDQFTLADLVSPEAYVQPGK